MKFFALIFAIFLLSACSIKQNLSAKSVFVSMKLENIRLNDAGFLYLNKNSQMLEIYKLAKPILRLKIANEICLNSVCYEKKVFNEKYFKKAYYDDFLSDLLNFAPIFNARNLIKTECGFMQNINNIKYEICNNELKFSDDFAKIILREN